jgi:hypothetical protein
MEYYRVRYTTVQGLRTCPKEAWLLVLDATEIRTTCHICTGRANNSSCSWSDNPDYSEERRSSRRIDQGCPTFFCKWPQHLLWTGLQATCVKITIHVIFNCLNYRVILLCICIHKRGHGQHDTCTAGSRINTPILDFYSGDNRLKYRPGEWITWRRLFLVDFSSPTPIEGR